MSSIGEDEPTPPITPVTPVKTTQHYTQFTPNEMQRMIKRKIKSIIEAEDEYLRTNRPDLIAVNSFFFTACSPSSQTL
jgi:hypothetical protein